MGLFYVYTFMFEIGGHYQLVPISLHTFSFFGITEFLLQDPYGNPQLSL
jgi:hypothetical protein